MEGGYAGLVRLGLGCAVKTVVMSLEFWHKVAAASLPRQNPSTVGAISPARPRGRGHTPISDSRLLQRYGALLSQWTHIIGGGVCRSRSERAPLSPFPAEAISCLAVWNSYVSSLFSVLMICSLGSRGVRGDSRAERVVSPNLF